MASAIALLRRYHQVEQKLAAAKAILEERRFIERAKAILMQGPRKTEPQTYAGCIRRRWTRTASSRKS
jgi:two-component system, response regulator / RNA-binding antiterminator